MRATKDWRREIPNHFTSHSRSVDREPDERLRNGDSSAQPESDLSASARRWTSPEQRNPSDSCHEIERLLLRRRGIGASPSCPARWQSLSDKRHLLQDEPDVRRVSRLHHHAVARGLRPDQGSPEPISSRSHSIEQELALPIADLSRLGSRDAQRHRRHRHPRRVGNQAANGARPHLCAECAGGGECQRQQSD